MFVDEFCSAIVADEVGFAAYLNKQKSETEFSHYYIHKTGLFYGCVTNHELCVYKHSEIWNGADKFKIAMVEGLFLAYFVSRRNRITPSKTINYEELAEECLRKIFDFYVLFTIHDSQAKKYRLMFSKSKDVISTVEQVFDCRVSNPTMLNREFWKGSQFNIMSGLDVVYFSLWLQGIYAYDRRVEVKRELYALMNQSCRNDKISNKCGQAIVSYFAASGNFGPDVVGNGETSLSFDFAECVKKDADVIRLLLFEYASYARLVDESFNLNDVLYLLETGRNLKLNEDEMHDGFSSIEDFLEAEGKNIFYLKYGEGVDVLKNIFMNRFQAFVVKNKSKIVTEISESKELVELLRKSASEDLSAEEKQKVREQILDLLKTIPSLAIFMIPGGMMILPVVLKILPEEILMPSSFLNKKN